MYGVADDGEGDDEAWPEDKAGVSLAEYALSAYPVTVSQYRPFVEGGGYTREKDWTRTGWSWRESEEVDRPKYWEDARWNAPSQPVVGVSWHEAVAYCGWLNERLTDRGARAVKTTVSTPALSKRRSSSRPPSSPSSPSMTRLDSRTDAADMSRIESPSMAEASACASSSPNKMATTAELSRTFSAVRRVRRSR